MKSYLMDWIPVPPASCVVSSPASDSAASLGSAGNPHRPQCGPSPDHREEPPSAPGRERTRTYPVENGLREKKKLQGSKRKLPHASCPYLVTARVQRAVWRYREIVQRTAKIVLPVSFLFFMFLFFVWRMTPEKITKKLLWTSDKINCSVNRCS